jgi:hypothetical protein
MKTDVTPNEVYVMAIYCFIIIAQECKDIDIFFINKYVSYVIWTGKATKSKKKFNKPFTFAEFDLYV